MKGKTFYPCIPLVVSDKIKTGRVQCTEERKGKTRRKVDKISFVDDSRSVTWTWLGWHPSSSTWYNPNKVQGCNTGTVSSMGRGRFKWVLRAECGGSTVGEVVDTGVVRKVKVCVSKRKTTFVYLFEPSFVSGPGRGLEYRDPTLLPVSSKVVVDGARRGRRLRSKGPLKFTEETSGTPRV